MKNFIYNSLFSYQKYGLKIAYKRNKEVSKMWEDCSIGTRSLVYQPVLTRLQALGLDLDNTSIKKFWGKKEVKPKIKNLLKTSKSIDIKRCWFDDLDNRNNCTWIDIKSSDCDAIQKPRIIKKRKIKKLILKTFKEKVKDETKVIIFEYLGVTHISFMENYTCLVVINFYPKKRGV